MITDLLDQIDRLDQEATKAPWTATGDVYGGKVYEPSGYPLPGCTSCGENEATYEGQDAEFIALARTALPQLAKALQAAMDCVIEMEEDNGDDSAYSHGVRHMAGTVRHIITDTLGDDDAA